MAPSLKELKKEAAKLRRARAEEAPAPKRIKVKAVKKMAIGESSRAKPRTEAGASRPPRAPSPIDLTFTPPEEHHVEALPTPPPEAVAVTQPAAPEATQEADNETDPLATAGATSSVPAEATAPGNSSVPLPPSALPAAPESTEAPGVTLHSILEHHARWAERTMAQAHVPELMTALQHQGTSTFFREISVTLLWLTNSTAAVRNVLSHAETSINDANSAATLAENRAEHAEHLLSALQAERADQAERAEKAEEELRLMTLDRDICQSSLDTANVMKSVAEERAENAEEIARRSDTELSKARLTIQSILERATIAEGKMAQAIAEAATAKQEATEAKSLIAEMEKKVAEAVEDFRHSSAYDREIIESTAFAYNSGFADCKAKVAKAYGLDGLDSLEPDDNDEEEPEVPPSDASPH